MLERLLERIYMAWLMRSLEAGKEVVWYQDQYSKMMGYKINLLEDSF